MKRNTEHPDVIDHLRIQLTALKANHGLCSMKTGTEVEDMSFGEIQFLRQISAGIVPLYVKIGGPEARNDIRNLIQIQVDGIIAPMIESPYALKNFITAFRETSWQDHHSIELGINLETITGYRQMHDILSHEAASSLSQVTAARTDLSGSMELHADDERVLAICDDIVKTCSAKGLTTSVGGAIHPGIIETLITKIHSDHVNTRHMVLSTKAIAADAKYALIRNLQFEIELYRILSNDTENSKRSLHFKRSETLQKRLETSLHFIG